MNALKLQIDELDEVNFYLIAIHTQLEDYRLAYFINKLLNINLSKSKNDIVVENKKVEIIFTRFLFEDSKNDFYWDLCQNKSKYINLQRGNEFDLFKDLNQKYATNSYLIPEYKKADYFLKIDNYESSIKFNEIIRFLQSIDKISTAYSIETENLKSKNNLIFQ